MRFLLIYFTGTYHTRFLTDEVEENLKGNSHLVDRVEINCDTQIVDTKNYDMIGFSYPIYGFNSPRPFIQYVKKLNFVEGQKYFVYKNSGETFAMNNASNRDLNKFMKKRKCVLVGEYHFVMPYNIHFLYEHNFVREILEKDEKLKKIMIYNLENGIVKTIKSKKIYNLASWFVSIQRIGGDVNSFLYKVNKEKCVKCMKCINSCPEKNIYIKDDKIKFHHHCDMCMRCSFYCPTDAIKIGFLDWWGWRVNGDYKLKQLKNDKSPITPYINENSNGFYSCFIKTFKEIDEEYEKLFGKENININEDNFNIV